MAGSIAAGFFRNTASSDPEPQAAAAPATTPEPQAATPAKENSGNRPVIRSRHGRKFPRQPSPPQEIWEVPQAATPVLLAATPEPQAASAPITAPEPKPQAASAAASEDNFPHSIPDPEEDDLDSESNFSDFSESVSSSSGWRTI